MKGVVLFLCYLFEYFCFEISFYCTHTQIRPVDTQMRVGTCGLSLHTHQVAQQAGTYPGFSGMKQLKE